MSVERLNLNTENMKKIILLIVLFSFTNFLFAQKDTTRVKILEKNVVSVEEDSAATKVKVGNGGIQVIANHAGDTVSIRIGNRTFDVIERDGGTEITTSKEPREKRKNYGMFNGHWAGFELGINTFHTTDYSLYNNTEYKDWEFFDLNYGKSLTFNMNFAEFAFSNQRKTVGFLTGLGFSFVDYRFDQDITVGKTPVTGKLIPIELDSELDVIKSKLNVSYLTAPLILEIATPLKLSHQRMTIAAGVIGGINIGSHTKIKYKGSKDKERGNFNINPFKYELTGRLGFGEFCVFANYSMSPLFKNNKGPELYPLVIGISFPNVNF
jgi:hypothetical protein